MQQLSSLLHAQAILMEKYQLVYRLPDWPLDIDSREDQETLRHFISSLTEELVEFWEAYSSLLHSVLNNQLQDKDKAIKELNLELADCLHFILELMVYSDLNPDHLEVHINALAVKSNYTFTEGDTLMEKIRKLGKFHTTQEGLSHNPVLMYPMKLSLPYLAGNIVTNQNLQILPILLWDLITCLFTAQNTLKNKAWKLEDTPTDTVKYNEAMLQGIYIYFVINFMVGATPESIMETYFEKNNINHTRIKNKY